MSDIGGSSSTPSYSEVPSESEERVTEERESEDRESRRRRARRRLRRRRARRRQARGGGARRRGEEEAGREGWLRGVAQLPRLPATEEEKTLIIPYGKE